MTRFVFSLMIVFACVLASHAQGRSLTAPALKNDSKRSTATPAQQDVPPPPPASADEEVVRVETNLVTTPVSVLDRQGRFIAGLRQRDFKIFENDVPQQITYFQSSEQPFTVILLIDISPSTRYRMDEIHYAAVTFINQLRPTDKVMVAAFDQRLRILSEPTTEKAKLFAAIYKSQFGSGTSIYDAVDYVLDMDIVNIPGRKAVVMFTDGVDTTSRRASFESTVAGVEEVDALFYPIRYDTLRGADASTATIQTSTGMMVQLARGMSEAEHKRGKTYLETLAANSGGRIFEADTTANLETAFAGVAEELRRQYSIGYYASEDGKPGDRKRIKIQVSRPPRAVVRAKTNYVVKQKDKPGDAGVPPSSTIN